MIPTYCLPCPKLSLVYIQIPKAANSSIIHTLNKAEKWTDPSITDHQTIQDHVRPFKVPYSESVFLKYKSFTWFTFVRNPYSRIVSSYVNKVLEPKSVFESFSKIGIKKDFSFLDFCRAIEPLCPISCNDHIKPQSVIMPKEKMDFIGKVENIELDWATLSARCPDLPKLTSHLNKSEHVHPYSGFLCEASSKIINDFYSEDFFFYS
jgi:hypothetical protein